MEEYESSAQIEVACLAEAKAKAKLKEESTAETRPETIAKPETSEGALMVRPTDSHRAVALDRAIGNCIDFTAIGLVTLIPCLFRYYSHPLPDNTFVAIFNDTVMFASFCLTISPLPLLYLRFVFRKLLRSPTPGEMFAGTMPLSEMAGYSALHHELLYGIFQYGSLALGASLGVLAISLYINSGIFGIATETERAAAWATLPLFALIFAVAANWPRSKSDYGSTVDYLCGYKVRRLR